MKTVDSCAGHRFANCYQKQTHKRFLHVSFPNFSGGPSLLHDIISKDGVDISAVNHMSAESIKGICEKCNILTSHKSVERMKIDIQA